MLIRGNLYVFEVCRNCRAPCEDRLCVVCIKHPECTRCHRRLPAGLFATNPNICDTCLRKAQNCTTRTALDGVVIEHDLSTNEADIDVNSFLENHDGELRNLLQRALDANM